MNCEQALILISGHIDGQNTAEEEMRLQAHLETCTSCREILRAYEEIDAEVASLQEEPPRTLVSDVMEQITAPVTRGKRRFIFGGGTAIAAVAAALLLVIGTGRLPDLQQSKASTARTMDESQTEPAAQDIGIAETEKAYFYAAFDAPELERDGSATDEALVVQILDNVDAPAAEMIAELAELPAEESIEDGGIQYWSDVATANAIAAAYGEQYEILVPEAMGRVEANMPCAIRIVEP